MTCQEIQPLISVYMDEACSSEEAAAVEGHLRECAECRALLAELRRTVELVSSLPQDATSAAFVPALSARLKDHALPTSEAPRYRRVLEWLRHSRLRWQVSAVAAAALLVMGVVAVRHIGPGPTVTPPRNAIVLVPDAGEPEGDDFLEAMLGAHRAYVATAQPVGNAAFTYASYDDNR